MHLAMLTLNESESEVVLMPKLCYLKRMLRVYKGVCCCCSICSTD
uniref:Uncharacterized protein n=1 Tax=Siphoviridae sp. ctj0M16 TaxID=2827918 RepID=A0A8S5S7A1_9CAUD|nr:MAG TPA: hypothetical protein [Siphoviridae sp. ctj0M16]